MSVIDYYSLVPVLYTETIWVAFSIIVTRARVDVTLSTWISPVLGFTSGFHEISTSGKQAKKCTRLPRQLGVCFTYLKASLDTRSSCAITKMRS